MILQNASNDRLKPLELLDLVYVTGFEAVPKEELKDVLQLIGLVLLPDRFKKSAQVLDAVLCLEPGTTLNHLRYLHSVLKVPSAPNREIAPLHATLGDIIFHHDRSHTFGLHVDQQQFRRGVVLKILKGSMLHTASERLDDYRRDWFEAFYYGPVMEKFIKNRTFRTTLAAHIKEGQRRDTTLWPPLVLTGTYRIALKALTSHSSWFNIKDNLFLWGVEKKRRKEVLRRLRSYLSMGVTGQLLVFLQVLYDSDVQGRRAANAFRKALPDQSFLATQKLTGLALPCGGLESNHADKRMVLSMFAEPFVNPTFVETFFTTNITPWDNGIKREEAYLLRLLSLRNLPQENPCWSNAAKAAFDAFLDEILHKLACVKSRKSFGPRYEATKKELQERAAALESSR